VEFAQGSEHGLSLFAFPTPTLPCHAMMHNSIDPTFNDATANGVAGLPKEGILHFGLTTLKIGQGLKNIVQARNMVPIRRM
jgi:hypothetical protein